MNINPTDTPFGPPDPTPAVDRASAAILEATFGQELPEAPIDLARAALAAALDVEEMAAKLWELDDVGGPPGFPWRGVRDRIKRIYRDQARDLRAALLGEEAKADA